MAGVEHFVGPLFVRGTVKLVGAALGGEVVQAAHHLAEFRGKIRGLDGELGDGFNRGRRHGAGPGGVVVAGGILAFEINLEIAAGQTVHFGVGRSSRHARREIGEAQPVADAAAGRAAAAEVDREVVDFLAR